MMRDTLASTMLSLLLAAAACGDGKSSLTDAELPPEQPPEQGVIFQSNFSSALGNSDAAQSDGGKWEHLICPESSRRPVLEVVPGSQAGWTLTPNILRVNNTGNPTGSHCGMVQTRLNVPLGHDFYIRTYIRVENEDDFNFHAVNLHYGAMEALPWSIFDPVASVDYNPKFTIETPSGNQYRRWKPTQKLRQREWYRFEWHVQYVNVQAQTARIWPRIYDMQNNLLYDARTHVGIDQSQITLQQFYDQGGVAHFGDLDAARHFAFGYEGRTQQQDQTRHWYHAAVEIRSDTWPGPISR
jgi:hypothetical protein